MLYNDNIFQKDFSDFYSRFESYRWNSFFYYKTDLFILKAMRKFILNSLIILFAFSSSASIAQVRYGVKGGFQFSGVYNHILTNPDRLVKSGMVGGFHGGVFMEMPIKGHLYFHPNLLFTMKGYKNPGWPDLETHAYYLEMPLNVIYKLPLGNRNLLLGVGPYLGYGLGGKWKISPNPDRDFYLGMEGNLAFKNESSSEDFNSVIYGSTLVYGKPLDFGGNVLVGYEISRHVSLQLTGQMGLINLAPKIEGAKTINELRNYGFGFSLGYLL